jgi:hypothetical protein
MPFQESSMSTFEIRALDHEPFAPLFELHDDTLARMNIRRVTATASFGFPCRISLTDAEVGEELLLLPFQHQSAPSPYQSSGAIFVRRGATRRTLDPGEVPPYVTRRKMSLRAYDDTHMMIDADVIDGEHVAERLTAYFARPEVAYVHLHNAKPGCYSSLAVRA